MEKIDKSIFNTKTTTNNYGMIVSGSKATIKGDNTIYDVGEIIGNKALLYKDNKYVTIELIEELEGI